MRKLVVVEYVSLDGVVDSTTATGGLVILTYERA